MALKSQKIFGSLRSSFQVRSLAVKHNHPAKNRRPLGGLGRRPGELLVLFGYEMYVLLNSSGRRSCNGQMSTTT